MSRAAERARVWLTAALLGLAGAAQAATEFRELDVGDFSGVHFQGTGTVRLTQGNAAHLAVHGAVEVLETVQVDTRDGVLYIDATQGGPDLVLELQVADLTRFVSEGDGRITGENLSFDALLLEGAGGGSFDLRRLDVRDLEVHGLGATHFDFTGQVANQVIRLSGTGAYRAVELISDCVSINVAGASDVGLWAEEVLDVVVAGAAQIRYAGSPKVEQQVSGLARVQQLPGIII